MVATTAGLTKSADPHSAGRVWGLGILLGLAVVAAGAVSVVNGPSLRAASEAAIERENQSVCAQLGMGPATGRYADCAAVLAVVRANAASRNEQSIL